ncbi:hypothetical protein Q6346_14745 [Isoptericola sp. b490]|uniref:hypothetical protein n=1 Tax=Actinotalea lenta TaxID=3064654 RepID=UPI0027138DED|nr:hypothetical protein [Isoptericola sp. b490]MDO8122566.1 hypothetical protein [Isoptericola sp. b490]
MRAWWPVVVAISALLGGCSPAASATTTSIPTTSDSATPDTGADVDAARAATLAQLADAYGLKNPPTVAVVREVTPDEFAQVQADCMTQFGFPQDASGGYSVPNDQAEALHLAIYKCTAMFPTAAKYSVPLDEQQLELVYDYYVNTLVPCLKAHGSPVDQPPSKQTFLGTIGTADEYSPYASVTGDESQLQALQDACPALPPTDELYGDG